MLDGLSVFVQVNDLAVGRVDGQGHVGPVGAKASPFHLHHIGPKVNTRQALDTLRL